MTSSIYQFDSEPARRADFIDAELGHLLASNRGRLRDTRRTPLKVTRVMPAIGSFEVELEAFEDKGARWTLPLTAINRLQFPRDARRVPEQSIAELRAAAERFDQPLEIPVDAERRARTLKRIRSTQATLRDRLLPRLLEIDLPARIRRREGSDHLGRLFTQLLDEHALAELDGHFVRSFVSNPHSGEMVKGHAVVLAELGICPYSGTIIRDPSTFAEPWTKPRREDHLTFRIAATQTLWAALGCGEITLYRGAASDSPFKARPPASLVSATFSEDVARAHYDGGPTTRTAILCRQRVSISRLLITFLETPAMNERYHEAEAVLIGDPDNAAF